MSTLFTKLINGVSHLIGSVLAVAGYLVGCAIGLVFVAILIDVVWSLVQ